MILPGSYTNGFAPRDGQPLYPELWRGCVGAWAPCLGPTGLTLRDWSGFGNHGTLTNMDAGTDWVASQGRYAASIAAAGKKILITPINCGTTYTISFWMNTASINQLVIAGTSASGGTYAMYADASGWYHNAIGSYCLFNTISASSWQGKWTHVAMRRRGTTSVDAFRDGRYVQTSTLSGANSSLTLNSFGAWSDSDSFRYFGLLGDIRFYARDLSDFEIRLLGARRCLPYELTPRRRSSTAVAGFNPSWVRRRALVIGGGIN